MTEGPDIGARLFELRDERDWTQDELAKEAGISHTTIVGIETGRITQPRTATLRRLARAFDMSLEQFIRVGEERRSVKRVSEEELKRAVYRLTTFNEKRQQEIEARKAGEEIADTTWRYEVESTERSLTEDFEEQGILEFVKEVNQRRLLASDEARWLSLLFAEAFTVMIFRTDLARLLTGLTEAHTEVQTRRETGRGVAMLEEYLRHEAPEGGAWLRSAE